MAVDRREHIGARILRVLFVLVGVGVAVGAVQSTAEEIASPRSPIRRYRDPLHENQVQVRGTLHQGAGAEEPPLCRVSHEHWQQCGKNRCWRELSAMSTTQGTLDVTWSSTPLPPNVKLGGGWRYEPFSPSSEVVYGERANAWADQAARAGLAFPRQKAGYATNDDRIVQRCMTAGTEVFLDACLDRSDPAAPRVAACPGQPGFYVVQGPSAEPAIDDAANGLAWRLSIAFAGLLVALLALVPRQGVLAEALAARAGRVKPAVGAFWTLLAIPPVAGFVNVLFHGSQPPSTWATGRGGYVLASAVLVALVFLTRGFVVRRATLRAALGPVLATERSPLARASGTAELAVRARAKDGGVVPVLDTTPVAFAEAVVTEIYHVGKSTGRIERARVRPAEVLEVVDESGDGVLHLGNAILDVEVRKVSFPDAPPLVPMTLARHEHHHSYEVVETIIRDGEPLYVFGDVSELALRADEAGYRAVRGSPTLGVAPGLSGDAAPVIVYAGDERGLVASLAAEAQRIELLTLAAFGAAGLFTAALAYVAFL